MENALKSSNGSVQVISAAPNPELEALCGRTHTRMIMVETPEAAAIAIEEAYLGLLARYEVTYESASPAAQRLEVRVRSPEAWGTAEISIPAPAL